MRIYHYFLSACTFFLFISCAAMDADNTQARTAKLREWLTHSTNNFFAHSIQPNCLDSVLAEKRLAPAELILREKQVVNFEGGYGQGRSNIAVDQKELALLQGEFSKLPQICRGVSYIKVEHRNEEYRLIFSRPNEKDLLLYYSKSKEDFFSPRKNEFYKQLNDIFVLLTNKPMTDLYFDVEIPVLDCRLFNTNLTNPQRGAIRFASGNFTEEDYEPEFEATVNKFRELVRAKTKVPYGVFLHLLDEHSERKIKDSLLATFKAFSQAIDRFYDNYKLRLDISTDSLAPLVRDNLELAQANLEVYRIKFFEEAKLFDTISFSVSKILSDYGNTTILVGNAEKRIKSGQFEVFNCREYRTKGWINNGGNYSTVNLVDDDIIIIGPRKELQEYSNKLPELNIIFSDEIPGDIKQYLPVGTLNGP